MKRTTKPNYAPPTSEVVEVKFQGVLCQSPVGGGMGGNDPCTPGGDPFNPVP